MAKQKKENTFENNLQLIEEIIEKLNDNQLPLEEAIKLHAKAIELIKSCEEILEKASLQFETLNKI